MHIAIDAAGGDFAPRNIIDGALVAARHGGFGLTLVGHRPAIEAELARHGDAGPVDVRFVDAVDVVGVAEPPAAAIRRKPKSSVRQAAEVVARGDAAAFFSAGNTGAALLAAHAAFGLLSASSVRRWPPPFPRAAAARCCWTPAPTSSAGPGTLYNSPRWGACTRACRWAYPGPG